MQNFTPAKILSCARCSVIAQVQIDGLTATFAYPVGDDDRDTEIQVLVGADVFERASFDAAAV